MKNSDKIESPSSRAKRTLSRRVRKSASSAVKDTPKLPKEKMMPLGGGDPPPPQIPFKYINAPEQLRGNSPSGSVSFQQDLFDVLTPASPYVLILTSTPLPKSEHVSWNGLVLRPGSLNDYTIVGNVITLNVSIVVRVGDEFLVSYSY